MTEQEILRAWRTTVAAGSKIKHKADRQIGLVLGVSSHPSYDFDVSFDDGIFPCYRHNLLPDWWPEPAIISR